LGFTMIEQIAGFANHERCKMRMEWIKPHLRFRNLNGSCRFPDIKKHCSDAIVDKIGLKLECSFNGSSGCVEVRL
jgi:hypothetical protein